VVVGDVVALEMGGICAALTHRAARIRRWMVSSKDSSSMAWQALN